MKRSLLNFLVAWIAAMGVSSSVAAPPSGAIVPVSLSGTLAANDDNSTGAIPLNIGGDFGINFFGRTFYQVYINNNGNITFGDSFGNFTPNGLAAGVGLPIIAPFFADVDTTGSGSGVVQYGNAVVNQRAAFVANYVRVGYFESNTDKLNSFQVILIDRSDTGTGNFDIQMNYNQILWETGDADNGVSGLGGTSAVAGFSNGLTGDQNVYYEFPGSLVNGALLDGGPHSLVAGSFNSTVPGRYTFQVRNGIVTVPPPVGGGNLTISGSGNLGTIALGGSIGGTLSVSGGTPPYSWTNIGDTPAGITVTPPSFGGTPTAPGNYSLAFAVTDSAGASVSGSLGFSVFGLTSTSLPQGILFSPYQVSVGVAGGAGPFTFSFSGLPAGLSGNVSGVITGSVTKPGTSSVTVTVSDSNGVSVSKILPLIFITPPVLSVSGSTLPDGSVGQTYSQVIAGATGGAPPYSWSLAAGSLPDGLSLRPGGTISGLPSRPGTFAFSLRATDVTGASAVGGISLKIAPIALSFAVPTLPSGMANVEYPAQMIAVQGGVPPYTFSVTGGSLPNSVKPSSDTSQALAPRAIGNSGIGIDSNGMISGTPTAAGSFSFTVSVTDAAGSVGSANLGFTIRPFSTDLVLSSGSLEFPLVAGAVALPAAQSVNVQSTTPTTIIPYSVSVTPSSADWLTVSSTASSTPGTVTVSLNSRALLLAASTAPYQAVVSVSCLTPAPCLGNSQSFNVNLTVKNAPPQLSIQNDLLSFTGTPGATQALSQPLGLQNSGGGSIGFASVSCAASWCSVSGVPGSLSAGQSASPTVSVDPSALSSAGFYRTLITIKASTGTSTVPVTLFVSASPSVSLQPAGEQFQSVAGGTPNGPLQSFLVDVSGSAAVSWSAAVLPGANWLKVSSAGGMASPSQPGAVSFTLDQSIISGLSPQTYYGTIRVATSGTVNSPQDFQVVLNIAPAGTQQRPNPSPAGLLFITQGAAIPPAQTVTISTSSTLSVSVQASTTTSDGGAWLSVTPTVASAQPGNPLLTKVSVNPSGLAPGVYTGGVNYAYTGLAVRTVNVTLIVSPAPKPALTSDFAPLADPLPNCSPKLMAAAQTGLVTNFSQPTAWPTPLQILLVNDCGGAIPNGQVVATFSNGDPPLPLNPADTTGGLYTATWTPRKTSQQTTITMRATAAGFAPVTTQLAGTVTPGTAPLLSRNSTQHVYNPLAGGGLAPGTLVQVSGMALSSKSMAAPAGPLPTSLNSTQVLIGGIPAPISSVSPGLLNVELPFGLTPGNQYQIVVSANNALTTPDGIQLVGTSPGVASGTGDLVLATHSDGTAVTELSPAAPGEALVVLAAGLGITDSAVADGALSPSQPLANAVSVPTITVDGAPAAVSFAGLQAGSVGIYQINFTVPTGANNGDLTLTIIQDGQPGNSTVLPVKAKAQPQP